MVKRGKTVRAAILDQQFAELADLADDRVRDVLARARSSYVVEGRELTPAQLLERLGFAREHLSARVGELSGGQKRRLQLLLVLLGEPNVLILDEPSNDVDTEMLAAMEDLLDTWPGTLIVVSHDRYLVERATDQQYAILDGRLRHLPGGVDEYLRLRQEAPPAPPAAAPPRPARPAAAADRALRKELGATERGMARLDERIDEVHRKMAEHDHGDYQGMAGLAERAARAGGPVRGPGGALAGIGRTRRMITRGTLTGMAARASDRDDDDQPHLRLAVLIDADNAQASLIEPLLAEVARYGEATVRRIYGDFTSNQSVAWKKVLQTHAIKPVQQFAYTTRQERHRQRSDHRRHGPALHPAVRRLLPGVQRQRLHRPCDAAARGGAGRSTASASRRPPRPSARPVTGSSSPNCSPPTRSPSRPSRAPHSRPGRG